MITGKGYIVENYILLTLESRQLSQKTRQTHEETFVFRKLDS